MTPRARAKRLEHAGNGPFRSQLLKWIGNKQRQAAAIIGFFPDDFGTYFEPFLGSGGVLGVLSPRLAIASDGFRPLMEIWRKLPEDKDRLKSDYAERYGLMETLGKARGVRVALSIDGTKLSGRKICDVPVPQGLFAREEFIAVGRSMLKRIQMDGRSLESHHVSDRLFLTYWRPPVGDRRRFFP